MIISKKNRIFLAGHRGMVGSAIYRKLFNSGYSNILTQSKKKLDLLNQKELSGIDGFTLIQCTSPFTKLETIKNITLEAFKNKCSSISIRELEHTYL